MATEEYRVGTYREFADEILPRIAHLGYNVVQIMAIAELPYYGSFGYHVANYFAPSSRCGASDDLKDLIDKAHGLGLAVPMDIVHSHSVKNFAEGLAAFDGEEGLYFHEREHPQWDSRLFDYSRREVCRFLLSNVAYWMTEFRFDGVEWDAVTYLQLAMGIPDHWIKLLKHTPDEHWNLDEICRTLTNRRYGEKTIAYAESHDQALVGDKTLAFRLIDSAMYHHMAREDDHTGVDRGMALHKILRLITLALGGEGYLTFMGNEFGHPEWVDFPREGNGWSYQYARRQWPLANNPKLKYGQLEAFDTAMMEIAKLVLGTPAAKMLSQDQANQCFQFERGNLIFAVNLSPSISVADYGFPVPAEGEYRLILSSDDPQFGGHDRIDAGIAYPSVDGRLKIYLPSRTVLVFRAE
jgi:1,4-alpha-glucan branching enzyme